MNPRPSPWKGDILPLNYRRKPVLYYIKNESIYNDGGTCWSPIVELFSFWSFHVDAAVRHGLTEIIVPISTVEGISSVPRNFIVPEEHYPGNIG